MIWNKKKKNSLLANLVCMTKQTKIRRSLTMKSNFVSLLWLYCTSAAAPLTTAHSPGPHTELALPGTGRVASWRGCLGPSLSSHTRQAGQGGPGPAMAGQDLAEASRLQPSKELHHPVGWGSLRFRGMAWLGHSWGRAWPSGNIHPVCHGVLPRLPEGLCG